MNEFEQKDYEGARNSADQVKTTAENIMSIFDNIDQVMNTLYNDAWQSQGAEGAKSRYQQIRKNYETFYNNVVAMKSHIYAVTASNEAQDAAVSNTIADLEEEKSSFFFTISVEKVNSKVKISTELCGKNQTYFP